MGSPSSESARARASNAGLRRAQSRLRAAGARARRPPPTDCPSSGAVCSHGADDDARRRRRTTTGSWPTSRDHVLPLRLDAVPATGCGTAPPSWASWARTRWATTWRAATTAWTRRCPTSCRRRCRLTGTLGAFIRIRQPIPNKRELFDIGIAGPIAGFLVAVPVLVVGVSLSHVVAHPAADSQGCDLGEPLLLKGLIWLDLRARAPPGYRHQPAPDRVRRLVRPAGHGAQPVPVRAARRRAHLLRRARPPQHAGDLRHAPLPDRLCRSCRCRGSCGRC